MSPEIISFSTEDIFDLIGAINAQISAINNLGFVSTEALIRIRRLNALRDNLVRTMAAKPQLKSLAELFDEEYEKNKDVVNKAIDEVLS